MSLKALKRIVKMKNHWTKFTQSFTSYRERANVSMKNMKSGKLKIRRGIRHLRALKSTVMTYLKILCHLGKTKEKREISGL